MKVKGNNKQVADIQQLVMFFNGQLKNISISNHLPNCIRTISFKNLVKVGGGGVG